MNIMTEFLLQLGIMSLQATVIFFVVMIMRVGFSKLHIAKKYTNLLWIIPYIAMILPWGIKTPFSFWQLTQEGQIRLEQAVNTMQYSTERLVQVTTDTDILREMEENRQAPPSLENMQSKDEITAENEKETVTYYTTEKTEESESFFHNLSMWDIFIYSAFSLWLLGFGIYVACGIISSLKLKKKLVCSLRLRDNVYVADEIKEPFVFGVLAPKIYIPCNLTMENEYYVVEHEKTHIYRKDSLKKPVAFFITGIHWFNPFSHMAFHMMAKDMEMACDEETIQRIGLEKRKDYATALLKLSAKKRNLLIPVAFGEGNVKSRIKNILKFKRTMKVLAVLAGVVIVIVAALFLTKPIEKTAVFGNMINYDVITMPKADNPRKIIVTYQGKEYFFDESYYDAFRTFLEELKVYEEELNKSRDEARPAEVVIKVKDSVAYNFDKNMETVWCNNGVKPSMTYELVEPKLAVQFLELKILECKVTDYPAYYFGFETMDTDLCGENGPFLDYANEQYVVFHTKEWFYVYDISREEMSIGIGFNNIYKVEVDEANLIACVHEVDGDAISVYECDIENGNCSLNGPIKIDAFGDFLLTSECAMYDPTVFRTKECIQTEEGKYLYLESGSGLLADLNLVSEDVKGNRKVYEIFDADTYNGETEKITQIYTGAYYLEPMDITHDGKDEYIKIDVEGIQADSQKQAYLKVLDTKGNVLWQTELGLARAGWNSFFQVWTKEGVCLLQYLPVVMQERGEYSYRLFYLNEDGSEVEVESDTVEFSVYPNNVEVDGEVAIPREDMLVFAEEVNGYLDGARMLISTVDGTLIYQTPAKTYNYRETYQTALTAVNVAVSESIDLNITKLQNYYEKTRKDILKKEGVVLIED